MFKLFTTTRSLFILTFVLFISVKSTAQISITALNSPVTENFNTLGNTGSGFAPISGWDISEPPSGDDFCDAGDGSSSTNGIYSFGSGTNSDRALGSITSTLNEPMIFGAKFQNNTSQAISSIVVQYTGEQWRLGQIGLTTDKLIFEYSTDATNLSNGTWIEVSSINFTAPVTTGTVGALDGNLTGNRTTLSANIAVNIATSGTIFIRWRDQHAGTADHGLAVDDFSITAHGNLTSGNYTDAIIDGTRSLGGNVTLNGTTIFVNSSSKLDIGSNTLTISGSISGTPIIKGSHTSNLIIDGSGSIGTFEFDQTTPGTTNVLNNFTLNRTGTTVTLGNSLYISDNAGSVNLTAGTLSTGGNLTLLSTFNGTARIGTIVSGTSDLTGNVNAQRYMQGGVVDYRGWRTMGAVTSNFSVNQLTDDIFVTGPGGASNGFDASGNNSSVMYYEEDFNASGGRGWKSISNTSATFNPGQGVLVFFRGDRTQSSSITNTSAVPNPTTIDVVGPINKSDVVVSLKYNDDLDGATEDGWNFVSNPYPSQIYWNNVSKTGSVDNNIAILNPLTNGYVTLGLTDYIPSHQGFFVKVNATGQSITFEENDKSSTTATPYFKTQSLPFSIKMYEDSVKYDIASLKFELTSNKNYIFKEDALKMTNSRINLGYVTPNGKTVQVNSIPQPTTNSTDTFIISTTSIKNGTHWLTFENKTILPANKNVFLVDGYNNNIIDVKNTNSYAFTINNTNSLTYGNRFKLIITDQFSALPVKLASFSGEKLGASNLLKWTSVSEKNLINYEVEKSVDGKNFESIGLVKATNSSANSNYSFVDQNIVSNSFNYYRLKINENKGVNSYSNIINISNSDLQNVIIDVYPNPAQNNISVKIDENNTFESAVIFDINGKQTLNSSSSNDIDISTLLPGVYTIKVKTTSSEHKIKFIKQ
jgi:hypothetical protein